MSAALQIHHIACPEEWPLIDTLHNYLWKRFPMDDFTFIESPYQAEPEYSRTILPEEANPDEFPALGPRITVLKSIDQAVRTFVTDHGGLDA